MNALRYISRIGLAASFLFVAFFSIARAQSISDFSPLTISAGTGSQLTINGSGFGTGPAGAQKYVEFANADDGGSSYIRPQLTEYVSWTDNKIVVKVPSDSGTGLFRVISGANTLSPASELKVSYSINNVGADPLRHINSNTSGGSTFQLSNDFAALTAAKNAFLKSVKAWTCQTGVNWIIGAQTTVNVVAADGINVVRFDSGGELPPGVLGAAYTYSRGCGTDKWEIYETDVVFDKERDWHYEDSKPPPSKSDFQSVALHEMGHAHNLGHVIDPADMMNFSIAGGTSRRTFSLSNQNGGLYQVNLSKTSPGGSCSSPMVQVFPESCNFPAPEVVSVNPVKGGKGTIVTITGRNFIGASGISFGGIAAGSFSVVSSDKIEAVVGEGATGEVSVTAPGGSIGYSGFTYLQSPVLTSFTPKFGFAGDKITLSGNHLLGMTSATFGGIAAVSFNVIDNEKAEATLAEGSSGDIVVKTEGGTVSIPDFIFVKPMLIASVSPMSGIAGDVITIDGSNFTGTTSVRVGGVAVSSFTVDSDSKISAILGAGASGAVSISSPYDDTSIDGFVFILPPLVRSFTPLSAAEGATVRISGENFLNATVVNFGAIPATSFVINSPTLITAIVGVGETGAISIETPGGIASRNGFTFVETLRIMSFLPKIATTGNTVIITGTKFRNVIQVSFGGVPAKSFTVNSSGEIAAIVGNGTSGEVTVRTSDGIVSLPGFKFIYLPTIVSFTPVNTGLGSTVTISGTNFEETTSVLFGEIPAASFKILSPTSIQAVVGSGATGSISLVTPVGSTKIAGFVFVQAPVISSIDPPRGGPGSIINIYGEHLTTTKEVSIGGKSVASYKIVSPTHITAIVANGTQPGPLTVITAGGTAQSNSFQFLLPPLISSFNPQNAIAGTEVIISGSNFIDISSVSFGGKAASSFKVLSATSISAIVAPASLSGPVSIVNVGGTGSLGGFTFNFTLPSNNFSISSTDLTCRGSANGLIKISAQTGLNYIATLTGNGQTTALPFTNSIEFKSQAAGNYTVCITIVGENSFKQCFEVTIREPKDLALYSSINQKDNLLNLKLEGAETYFVKLNGELIKTSKNELVLNLKSGTNTLEVTSDKLCQGIIQRTFIIGNGINIFPNPFINDLTIVLGREYTGMVKVEVRNIMGKILYSRDHMPDAGSIALTLPDLSPGTYLVQIATKDHRSVHKILKL